MINVYLTKVFNLEISRIKKVNKEVIRTFLYKHHGSGSSLFLLGLFWAICSFSYGLLFNLSKYWDFNAADDR